MLRVVHFCYYVTKLPEGEPLVGNEWDATKFVKAMKPDDTVNGYATIPQPNGPSFRLDESTRSRVFGAFAALALADLQRELPAGPIDLVPVPSSKSAIATADCSTSTTHKLANSIARKLGQRARVVDMLRWVREIESARKGGTREPGELFPLLRAVTDPSPDRPCILVDDNLATGGHLQASRARIHEKGGNVPLAICVAKTIHHHPPSAFAFDDTQLEDFDPELHRQVDAIFERVNKRRS